MPSLLAPPRPTPLTLALLLYGCGPDEARTTARDADVEVDVADGSAGDVDGVDDPTLAPIADFGWDGGDCPDGTTPIEGADDPRAKWCEKSGKIKHGPFGRWHLGGGTKAEGGDFADGAPTGTWRTWYPAGSMASEGARDAAGRTGSWTFWRGDRTRERVGGFSADLESGPWTSYWPDGATRSEGAYRDGLEDGTWHTFHPDGGPDETITYTAGARDGAYARAYPSGGRAEAGAYADDVKTGEWTTWYDNGAIASRGPYEAGLASGRWHFWQRDGGDGSEGLFVDGVQQGTWTLWQWQQGERIKSTGEVVDGLPDGAWSATHDPGGEDAGHLTYFRGSREGPAVTLWKSGHTLSEGRSLSNRPDGPWRFYYSDGTLFIACSFALGVLDGPYEEHYPDGAEKVVAVYLDGLPEPGATCWNEAGDIVECAL